MTRRPALVLVLVLLAALPGCSFFRPEDPEPPAEGQTLIPDYSTPDATLETMRQGVEAKSSLGGNAWLDAFAEAFVHNFWPEDEDDYESTTGTDAPTWNLVLEEPFYFRLADYRPGETYQMIWEEDDSQADIINAETATLHRHYQITAVTDQTAQIIAIGYADLSLVKDAEGNWRIVEWNDRRDPAASPTDTEQQTLGLRRLNFQGGT